MIGVNTVLGLTRALCLHHNYHAYLGICREKNKDEGEANSQAVAFAIEPSSLRLHLVLRDILWVGTAFQGSSGQGCFG